jgi:hypothetical protein
LLVCLYLDNISTIYLLCSPPVLLHPPLAYIVKDTMSIAVLSKHSA